MKLGDRIKELLDDCYSEGRFAFPINLASAVVKITEFMEEEERKRLHKGKAYDNVFEALDLPYEAAALDILNLLDPCPSGEVIKQAADIIRQVVIVELGRIDNI